MIIPVVLCGGTGTRLWPLSRKALPKQFVPLIDGKSLLQLALERVKKVSPPGLGRVLCVAAEPHRFLVMEAMQVAGMQGDIILEPVGRNTAPAMTLAALHVSPDDFLLFCPADHHIPDACGFAAMVERGVVAAEQGSIVTFGVVPGYPSTAYGYIQKGAVRDDGSLTVTRFIEKPTAEHAASMLLQGNVLWNAGVFLCRAGVLLDAVKQHAPDILVSCRKALSQGSRDGAFVRPEPDAFISCRAESIDYGVMEHFHQVVTLPFSGSWSDVGSWNAVAELSPPDAQGNRVVGQGLALQAAGTYIHASNRPVVALGTHNLFIVDTPDALLVAACTHAEEVRTVVLALETMKIPEADQHRRVVRPWGWFEMIQAGERFQVKRIFVKPGASLSLQMHHHRAEHWVVVRGTAQVTRGIRTFLLTENESTYIPIGEVHRLHNPGKTELEIIEVQSGSYLGEDDIVRLDDDYGRDTMKPG
ncbi:MAG: mannose-1-phosphate guanylyltransferase/mannose-6-phosphate isomerase [Pseudomonadota bacterium]|uniref:mannose-1-phosphate guanylyltransferase/mannose-6-phosphate isomerase n=1 Tax=Polaromonas sp. TaxID=1869339 RepID=UPI0017E71F4C|nr:mannose-1-phosphate guanylyltransferase/mannose-6-phosphate isomerase [Polaromonas sp.]MBA3594708.1 mannose-1-phosphate guanylyltransferase/mannose-6-phosphate isomerase [Polaromonas sp.]MDQ3272695.1 mannose-1-phosphate guanylyltransferase/mannose-6-phosphate isomerase [Pseudomonadota bacterium]